MKKLLAGALTLATLALPAMTVPAQALDLSEMDAAEQQAFGAAVRSYLLENPQVIVEAYEIYQDRQAEFEAQRDQNTIARVAPMLFEDERAWETGNPEGDIVMVEFLDYRCGYCKKAHAEVKELIAGDQNIRFIVKEFPILGEESLLASRFAIASQLVAGDEAYGQLNDALMEYRGKITEGSLVKLAGKLDLDGDAILGAMEDPRVAQLIADNRQLAGALAISGTPTFVVQDQLLRGYVPLNGMQDMIAALRAEQ
ncbi:DsbA family protein [Thalassobius sp. Cn5-15]|jgi:protein-disulfide isomerase|uniref:DsbA family protein n=1 Tax=Thalassobius sp. Cn5-15 TaxID=2917763 RepID=UPI001EF3B2ED|nr:DsbA family protein [Thalassobius sp. Cn5-15]MCG7492020.1 DsbA family protein [Thalassobius sp. Cn5-15]